MEVKKQFDILQVTEILSALLEPLTEEQRRYLIDNFELHVYDKGETIYSEDDTPRYVMCLLQGKVMISKNGAGGRAQIIRLIKEEEIFGYRPAITEESYSTCATTCERSTIVAIPISVFKKLVFENNGLAIFLIRQLASFLGDADTLTVDLTQKHTRGRLAQSLLVLKKKYGVTDDGRTLCANLSRKDIASMSNMMTNNAIRTLSAFASEGIIDIDGKIIRIIDENELRKISTLG